MSGLIVHVLTFEGCPHADAALTAATAAVAGCRHPVELVEVDLMDPEIPDELRRYPSPTILVDMKEVAPSEGEAEGLACRALGAPSAEEVRLAISSMFPPK